MEVVSNCPQFEYTFFCKALLIFHCKKRYRNIKYYMYNYYYYRIDFGCVSKRLYMCIETTWICIETTCIEMTLYRNDRKPCSAKTETGTCKF